MCRFITTAKVKLKEVKLNVLKGLVLPVHLRHLDNRTNGIKVQY